MLHKNQNNNNNNKTENIERTTSSDMCFFGLVA